MKISKKRGVSLLTGALVLFSTLNLSAAPTWPPETFTCYYGDITPQTANDLSELDLLVVHPGDDEANLDPEKIRMLRQGKDKTIVGYVTIGEEDRPPGGPPVQGEDTTGPSYLGNDGKVAAAGAGYPKQFLDQRRFVFGPDGFLTFGPDGKPLMEKGQDGHPDENGVWGSFYVRTDVDAWRNRVFSKMDALVAMGADGFFLDTVDTASPWGDYGWTSDSMLEFVQAIRARYPKQKIVANRGLWYLPKDDRYAQAIDAVLFESLLTHYNWETDHGDISPWAKWHVLSLDEEVVPAQKRTKLPLLVLDYLNPKQQDASILVQSDRTLLAQSIYSLSFNHPNLKLVGWTPSQLLPEPLPSAWPTLKAITVSETAVGNFTLEAKFSENIPSQAIPDLRVTNNPEVKANRAEQLAPAEILDWKASGNTLTLYGSGLDKNQNYTFFLKLISKSMATQSAFGWTSFTSANSDRPSQIQDLDSTSIEDGVRLSFLDNSLVAKSYRVQEQSAEGWRTVAETNRSPAIIKNLDINGAAKVRVVAVGADGQEGYPSLAHTLVRRDVKAPVPPGQVTVEQEDQTTRFRWEASTDASSYRLYVVPEKKPFRLPLLVEETETEVERVVPGRYKVFLTAVDESGNQSRPGPISTIEIR